MKQEQYALLIGASKGIGRAIAIHLSRMGYHTILVSRDEILLKEVQTICNSHAESYIIPYDITKDQNTLIKTIEDITPNVHVLWLGAAGYTDQPLIELTDEAIEENIRSGFEALIKLVRHTYPLLKTGHAHIIGACSDWSDIKTEGPSLFGGIKVGLYGFLEKLRKEVIHDGIKVTALKMGNIASIGYSLDDYEKQIEETGNSLVTLKDITDTIEYILTRQTGFVTEVDIIPSDPNY